jgi:excisionase family DNA binding protein
MVRKLVKHGGLTVVRIGRSVRVPRTEVLRLCGATEHQALDGPST